MEDQICDNVSYQAYESDEVRSNGSDDEQVSDASSCVMDSDEEVCSRRIFNIDWMARLDKNDMIYKGVESAFLTNLGDHVAKSMLVVEAIHRKDWSKSRGGCAKFRCFEILAHDMKERCHGNANVKLAWYGGSKEEITRILSRGFGPCQVRKDTGYAHGVCLFSMNYPSKSVQTCSADEDGLSHILLCRVLLGKTEFVECDSSQSDSSSDEFDTGIDDVAAPNRYIIWGTEINTHIMPEFVLSFRSKPFLDGSSSSNAGNSLKRPSSPWLSFPLLVSELSKVLPGHEINLISIYYKQFKERKLSRRELIKRVRQITRDDILVKTIISCWAKI